MPHPECQVKQFEVGQTENGSPSLTLELHAGVGFTFVLTVEQAAEIGLRLLDQVPETALRINDED